MANEKRLIDDSEVRKRIIAFATGLHSEVLPIDTLMMLLTQAPTVDAVEVVRCKDCVLFDERFRTVGDETGKVYCGGYCYHWGYESGMSPNQVDGDDFCSYGERRTDGSLD